MTLPQQPAPQDIHKPELLHLTEQLLSSACTSCAAASTAANGYCQKAKESARFLYQEVLPMAFRPAIRSLLGPSLSFGIVLSAAPALHSQVFVVGEKTATADVSTEFHHTEIELPRAPLNELGRRTLIRDLEAEQGFAHRVLPLATEISLMANGNMNPAGDAYKELIYKKGQSAAPGDRVAITTVSVARDRILLDINGGPYLKHRILRHIELNGMPMAVDDGEQVTGFRIALVFEGGMPDITAPEVKALLDPIIDFGVKSGAQAYADTLPPFIKQAIDQHDVLVGMNRRMVLAAMGAPESKVRELVPGTTTDQHYEEWIYGRVPQTVRFVRIEGDRVTQVRIAALGQPIAVHTENELQGFLDPEDTHEVAMGDAKTGGDVEGRAGPPPSILKPGESGAGAAQRVQYPTQTTGGQTKEQPLPAAPGSPADTSSTGTLGTDPMSENPGIGRTTPGSRGSGPMPGAPSTMPGSTPGSIPVDQP
jgi:hypothetical protein